MADAEDDVHEEWDEEQVHEEQVHEDWDETTIEEAAEESQEMHKGCAVGHLGEQCCMAAVD